MVKVGHFHYCFFERSETFIYHQITSLERYQPVAVSLVNRNTDEFDVTNGSLYDVGVDLPRPGMQFLYPFRYASLRLAAELFRREGISLLHAHFGTWGTYILPVKKSLRVPLVVTFYGLDMSVMPRRAVWRNRYQKLWEQTDLFLAEGPHMMSELIELGAPRKKVALQRIGIPVSGIDFRPVRKSMKGPPTAVWAGRMVEKKGLTDALAAVKILRDEGINVKLRVIGDGPGFADAARFVKKNDLKELVIFLGFLDYEDYLCEFRKADFFLASSRTSGSGETEGGAPTTILEAQASGLPVVATKHADIPFVLPRDYPYLANQADSEDLAAVIKRLLNARKKWQGIARKGRRHVEVNHDLTVTSRTLEAYYDELLNND